MKKSTLLIFLLAIGTAVFAQQTFNFTNASPDNNNWNNGGNWDKGTVPTINDDVFITGFDVVVESAASAGFLKIRSTNDDDASLTVTNNATLTISWPTGGTILDIGGFTTLTINPGASIEYYGDIDIAENGTLIVNGTMKLLPAPTSK